MSHLYDREGRESELTFPDGAKFWTARDGLGRTAAIHQGALGSAGTPAMVAFAYDWTSNLYYFARRFGDASLYGYDGAGRVTVIEDGFGAGIGNTRSELAYNPASEVTSESRTNDSYAWTATPGPEQSRGRPRPGA